MPRSICAYPGCQVTAPVGERYCDWCRDKAEVEDRIRARKREQRRGSSSERGYDYRWQRFRSSYLAEHPLCESCLARGEAEAANELHHRKKLADYPELKYEPTNLMPLCKRCHDERTRAGE